MAKKNKSDELDEYGDIDKKEGLGSKLITVVVAFVIVFIMLAGFALLIKLDVGGFGSNVLRPVLKDVPVINKVLPDVSDEVVAEEKNYPYKTLKEAIKRIEELEKVISQTNDNENNQSASIDELKAEIKRLKVFEDNQLEYEKRVLEFERNVVFADEAPSLEEYIAYYQSINPTNAEEIYRQVVEQVTISAEIKKFSDTFSSMKPAAAAPILETMTADLDLVSDILMNMKPAKRGAILAAMDPTMAAKVTKKMYPKPE